MSTLPLTARLSAAKCSVVAGGAVLLPAITWLPEAWQQAGALRHDEVVAGELWRLWTAHAVHFGARHALFDALALAALVGCALQRVPVSRLVYVGLGVAPLLSLAVLALEPSLREYRGASGLVMALLAWVGTDLWRRRAVGRRVLGVGAAVLAAKLVWDAWPGRTVGSPVLPPGVAVAWSAHLAGALVGLLLGLLTSLKETPGRPKVP